MYTYNAKVIRVIDGDTVVLNVDLGFRTWHESPFRLFGIDAPEINRVGLEGENARDFLMAALPVGLSVTVKTEKSADKYGRWLATIWKGELEASINTQMIEAGHAVFYDGGAR